eukprot:6898131-Lingulodinium_polyedra.AAC.1
MLFLQEVFSGSKGQLSGNNSVLFSGQLSGNKNVFFGGAAKWQQERLSVFSGQLLGAAKWQQKPLYRGS